MKKYNNRRRLLAVGQLFMKHHSLTLKELYYYLKKDYEIFADPTVLYRDIEVLSEFLPISKEGSTKGAVYTLRGSNNG